MQIEVSIIIINYNTFYLTCNCIRSVLAHTKSAVYEIILVDNASTECDPELFLNEFPNIVLIKSTLNKGFAGGNNLGIGKANGNYILLLNSDTVLLEDSISNSVKYLESLPYDAVLGCRMTYPNSSIQYSARRFRSIKWELFDLFKFIPFLLPYSVRKKIMLGKYFKHDENIECDWVNGAFFMFPKLILDRLPGRKLDERFFMYGEDQLWCIQSMQLGCKIHFFSGTSIIHIHSGSTKPGKVLGLRKLMIKNELEIARYRFGKGIYYFTFKFIFLFKEYSRFMVKWVVWKLTGKLLN